MSGRLLALLVVAAARGSRTPAGHTIHVIGAGGSGDRVVVPGFDAVWSPDGKLIAFRFAADGFSRLWAVAADGTFLRLLSASAGGAAWSSDARDLRAAAPAG